MSSSFQEITDESPSEKLLDAIFGECGDSSHYAKCVEIFNPKVDILVMVDKCRGELLDEWKSFEAALSITYPYDGMEYCHLTEFTQSPVQKGMITKDSGSSTM